MRRPIVLEFRSDVVQPRTVVWDTVSTMAGVNAELGPLVRMTYPRTVPSIAEINVVPGRVLFRSWVLFLGIIPLDRHALALQAMTVDAGFVEESTSWLWRRWRHSRVLADRDDGGCTVTDQLTIEPRIGVTTPAVRTIVRALFNHRHKQLRAFVRAFRNIE